MDALTDAETDAFLAQALSGRATWPAGADPDRVVVRARYHGLPGLLAAAAAGWPPAAREPLRRAALRDAMWDLRHRGLLSDLLAALAAEGRRALLLKGGALAYDLYPQPGARPRGDSDILVAAADLDAARRILADRGFAHFLDDPDQVEASHLQERWRRETPDGLVHDIDLHWAALNARTLAGVIDFDEAWASARPLPRLAPEARGLPLPLALLLAAAHRAGHNLVAYYLDGVAHYGGDRLIWLVDIDLIARALSAADWDALVDAATASGLPGIVAQALTATQAALGTELPPQVLARLQAAPQDSPAARYFAAASPSGRALVDLRTAPGLAGKLGYLRARLLPPAAFMRARYPDLADRALPVLYLQRLLRFLQPRRSGWPE